MTKYRSVKAVIDGEQFDSKKEANRWIELSMLQRAGKISRLRRQVAFTVIEAKTLNGHHIRPAKYIADFVYVENGKTIVEDVKGVRTQVYTLKKKLMFEKYDIWIRET